MRIKKNNQPRVRYFIWFSMITLMIFCLACKEKEKQDQVKLMDRELLEKAKPAPYIVEVTAFDYAFGMPTEIPSGWVTFRMKNRGQKVHHGIVYKYSDSISYDRLVSSIGESLQEKELLDPTNDFNSEVVTAMGGPAILSPGRTGETTVLLDPGVYALTCWLVAEDGEYHAMKGMTRPFVVTEEKSAAEKPEGTIDITLEDVAINIEDPIGPGEHVFSVNFKTMDNVHLAKLEGNQKLEDLNQWMNKAQNPSPFTFLGGAEQAPVGMTNTFKATLDPGRYALVTYGRAVNGMSEEFVIPEEGKAPPKKNEPVNPPLHLTVTPQGMKIPQEIRTGRTPFSFEATEDKGGEYVLGKLKDGKIPADVTKSIEASGVLPYNFIWYGTVASGEKVDLNLELQKGTYLLLGPLPPVEKFAEKWKADEMLHVFKVD